jgi:trk system potassium uptake protein TrkA
MKYIIVGCGRVGSELAYTLYSRGHTVAIIDHVASAFNNLHPDFRGRMIEGEALNRDVLLRAGIETADGIATVTNSDTLNSVVAHIARCAYHIPRVVVRNYDPDWQPLHEIFGHQIVSSSSWGAQRIEEMLAHPDMYTIYSAGNGEVEIYQFIISEKFDDQKLGDIIPNSDCAPVSLTRAGKAILPDSDTIVHESDIVLVSATLEGIQTLRQRLV